MKPNFALSLSFDGIKLLHRAAGGWREVGDVAITSDDLPGELAVLRKTAASLEPGGVRSKLIIPSSQIKYLTISTPGLSDAARRKEAEHALHDATPYEIADLVYDISVDGPDTHVAAVARETLAEAEAFATEHRFHPVSFVAVPEGAPYLGEPYFGPTQSAAELLGPSEIVEPDGIAVVVVGAIRPEELSPPVPQAQEPAQAEPEAVDTSLAEPEPTPEPAPAPPVPETVAESAPEPEAPPLPPVVEAVELPTIDEPAATAAEEDVTPEEEIALAPDEEVIPPVVEASAAPKLDEPELPAEEDAPLLQENAPEAAPEEPEVDEIETQAPSPAEQDPQPEFDLEPTAAMAAPVAATPSAPVVEEPSPAPEPVAEPDPVADEAEVAPDPAATEPVVELAPEPAPVSPPEAPVAPEPELETPEGIPAAARAAALTAAAAVPDADDIAPHAAPAAMAAPRLTTTGFSSRRSAVETPSKPLGGAQRVTPVAPPPDSSSLTQAPPVADFVAAPAPAKTGFFSRRKARKPEAAPLPAAAAVMPAAGSEAERMTVFGARASDVGGKPRFLGLIMTVILLVFLAGVAAWAAVFLDDGLAGLIKQDKTQTTASAPENQISPEIIRTPDGIVNDSTIGEGGVEVAALDPVLSAEETAVIAALQDPRPEPVRPVITPAEAAARYAVTGIWPLSPEAPLSEPITEPDPAYLNSIDPRTGGTDAIALPAPSGFETDTLIAAVASPAPFAQRAALDAAGLIKPTLEGIVTPGGYTLIAASPPIKPPANVLGDVVAPYETPEISALLNALAGVRPQNRPQGLAERSERAALGGVSRIELAAFRPSLRPSSIQERLRAQEAAREEEERKTAEAEQARAAAAATAAAAAALTAPQPTEAAVAAPDIESATRFATANSVRPDTRPRNFARIVRRAQRAAPKETRVAAASASVAPRTVTPSIPSRASVARSATVKNAINLRKVNLIGVYGKPSSRRALIRLSNGRYQKVKVGDRIDGGRVSAISSSELRYSKSGRNVVLKMP